MRSLLARFAIYRKPSTRAFRVEDEIELLLTVTRETKMEMPVSVGNQKSLPRGLLTPDFCFCKPNSVLRSSRVLVNLGLNLSESMTGTQR